MDGQTEGCLRRPSWLPPNSDQVIPFSIAPIFAESPIHSPTPCSWSVAPRSATHALSISSYSTGTIDLRGYTLSAAARSLRCPSFSPWRFFLPPAAYSAPGLLSSRRSTAKPIILVSLVPRTSNVHLFGYVCLAHKAGQHWPSPSPTPTSHFVLAATPSARLWCWRASFFRRRSPPTTQSAATTLRWIWRTIWALILA